MMTKETRGRYHVIDITYTHTHIMTSATRLTKQIMDQISFHRYHMYHMHFDTPTKALDRIDRMNSSPPADYIASIRLSVPADLAFDTIADLEGYPTWNTFTPKITPSKTSSPSASSASSSSPLPTAAQTTQPPPRTYPIGTPIVLKVKTLLPFPIIQRERISRWDLDSKEIAWSQSTLPRWALWTDRTQTVKEVESGAEADRNGPTGEAGCEYVTTMVSGLPRI
jgi:hypothetical protein